MAAQLWFNMIVKFVSLTDSAGYDNVEEISMEGLEAKY